MERGKAYALDGIFAEHLLYAGVLGSDVPG